MIIGLVDDGTLDTVVSVNGTELRYSQEFAADFRDETGAITRRGWLELREIAIEDYLSY